MAAPKIQLRRSSVPDRVPTNVQLQLGELAINTYDGKVYIKQDTGGVGVDTSVIPINPWTPNIGNTQVSYTGGVQVSGVSTFTSNVDFEGDIVGDNSTNISGISSVTAGTLYGDGSGLTNVSLGFKVIHASWDASSAGSFNWATDQISSSGVSTVTRQGQGIYRVTFEENFASANYTITTGVGSNDYSGANASPREVSFLLGSRTTSTVDVICERSDDAVNEDNAYMSIIIMGQ